MASEKVKTFTDANFADEVKSGVVLVDFWATWCAPCRRIAPIVDQLAEEFTGKLTVAKVDIDENPMTPSKFMVRGIPTLLLFRNGTVVDGTPLAQLLDILNQVSAPVTQIVNQVIELLQTVGKVTIPGLAEISLGTAYHKITDSSAASKAYARNQAGYLGQVWAVLTPALWAGVYLLVFGVVLDLAGGNRSTQAWVLAYVSIGIFGVFAPVARVLHKITKRKINENN